MTIKQALLAAPDGQLDASVKPLIEKWGEDPAAIDVLHVLDQCVRYALASNFTIGVLEIILNQSIAREGTSYAEVVAQATWRNDTTD